MLSDTELKKLKPTDKAFKVSGRDGMYVSVSVGLGCALSGDGSAWVGLHCAAR